MSVNDPNLLRNAKAYAKQQYEKQMVQGTRQPAGLDAVGPPTWSRDAWEAFKAAYGRYPSFKDGDIPNLDGCPDWAFELMGMRPPPVGITTGHGGATYGGMDDLALWKLR